MTSILPETPDSLLESLVRIARLDGRDLHDASVVENVLKAVQDLVPGSDPRVVLHQNERVDLYALASRRRTGVRHLVVESSPSVESWLTSIESEGEDAFLGRPDGFEPLLDGLPVGGPIATLRISGHLAGFVASGLPAPDADVDRLLRVVAEHAAVSLENLRLCRRLEHEADTDGLTSTYNYRYFMRFLDREMKRVRRHGGEFAVVMVDVDNLKEYNDRFGHLGGSAALREIAGIFVRGSRSVDVIAKYGGDEFSLLLPGCDPEGALVFCERMRKTIGAHAFEGDPDRRLTVSMGVALFPAEGSDPRDLMRVADARLYEAKRTGRDRIGHPV